jgi:hypothetical protein
MLYVGRLHNGTNQSLLPSAYCAPKVRLVFDLNGLCPKGHAIEDGTAELVQVRMLYGMWEGYRRHTGEIRYTRVTLRGSKPAGFGSTGE